MAKKLSHKLNPYQKLLGLEILSDRSIDIPRNIEGSLIRGVKHGLSVKEEVLDFLFEFYDKDEIHIDLNDPDLFEKSDDIQVEESEHEQIELFGDI